MSNLLRKPSGSTGKIIDVTPENAGWRYVGFAVHALRAGETAGEETGERETILVMVDGKAHLTTPEVDFGLQGERMSVFERTKPHAVYVPNRHLVVGAGGDGLHHRGLLCAGRRRARGCGHRPGGHPLLERGKGANTRYIHPIAMDDADIADSLLITEVYTPRATGRATAAPA